MSQRADSTVQRTRDVIQPEAGTRSARTVRQLRMARPGWQQGAGQGWPTVLRRAWQSAAPESTRVRVTARGALVGMFCICFASTLMASTLHLEVLIGLGFCTACVLAPAYAARQALLEVVASPPVIFLVALIIVQALTAQGDSSHASVLSVLEGTLLTLAAVAPWLLAGTAACVVIAMRRGLPQCVRELRAGARS